VAQLVLCAVRGVSVVDEDADSLVDGGEFACPGQTREESGRDVLVEANVAVQGEGQVGGQVDEGARR
jgi:hypothetical protein